ncbi:hypothetical protein Scep_005073 [Stephania cephalantha]|uniref:Uncharacterized protein n=1 Tax=Stephania cephalantha TaxID=152367 RepID=A0AAP0PXV1_9MAGN
MEDRKVVVHNVGITVNKILLNMWNNIAFQMIGSHYRGLICTAKEMALRKSMQSAFLKVNGASNNDTKSLGWSLGGSGTSLRCREAGLAYELGMERFVGLRVGEYVEEVRLHEEESFGDMIRGYVCAAVTFGIGVAYKEGVGKASLFLLDQYCLAECQFQIVQLKCLGRLLLRPLKRLRSPLTETVKRTRSWWDTEGAG